jgi:hypothetical protein
MGNTQQPFMYEAVRKDDDRFPAAPFDPKAVTRASYEKKKPKPKPDGPLVSFNRHPEYVSSTSHSMPHSHSTVDRLSTAKTCANKVSAHMVPSGRSRFRPIGRRTKGWIKGMRVVQLCLRVLESVAAVGIIVVMGLSGLIGWVMGVTVGLSDHLVSPY